tara:strand:- start:1997 stop:2185 length:189 start_codon:yes stop_codon:yes gene_type:complete
MAEIDYTQMDGLQVLWHLLTTEPFFWVLLTVGFVAMGFSFWFDRWEDSEHVKHYDDSHHINR